MTKSLFLTTLVAVLGLLAGGCATMTTGTTQGINVDSEPRDADCTLSRDGVDLGTVRTPAPITIRRHSSTVHVTCRKEGYEDSRVVMNARFETSSAGNLILGGVVGVIVDAASGANSRYDPYVMVRLTSMSPADQAAAANRPRPPTPMPNAVPITPPPATASAVTTVTSSASAAPTGPYDGSYNGDFMVEVNVPSEANRRIDVTVVGGKGTGQVLANRCPAGPANLSIDAAGTVSGEMDVPDRSDCRPLKTTITGKVVGGSLVVAVSPAGRRSIDVTLSRKGAPAVAIDSKFSGEYVGSVSMAGISNLRPIRIRFVNGRGSAPTDRPQCPRPGTIELVVTEDNKAVGEGSLVGDIACGLMPVKISGRVEGNNLQLTFETASGSGQFVFDRR